MITSFRDSRFTKKVSIAKIMEGTNQKCCSPLLFQYICLFYMTLIYISCNWFLGACCCAGVVDPFRTVVLRDQSSLGSTLWGFLRFATQNPMHNNRPCITTCAFKHTHSASMCLTSDGNVCSIQASLSEFHQWQPSQNSLVDIVQDLS